MLYSSSNTLPLEITSRAQGRQLTGFTVKMNDGKVLSWSPIIGESPNTFQPGHRKVHLANSPLSCSSLLTRLPTSSITDRCHRRAVERRWDQTSHWAEMASHAGSTSPSTSDENRSFSSLLQGKTAMRTIFFLGVVFVSGILTRTIRAPDFFGWCKG